MKIILLSTICLLNKPNKKNVKKKEPNNTLYMKTYFIIFFSMFSFFVFAQVPENKSKDLMKGVKKESNEKLKLNSENKLVSKNSAPDKGNSVPQEFYILNDKPVDKVTYLRSLKKDKK